MSFTANGCSEVEARLPVPLARLSTWLPAAYHPFSQAGQAVLRVATWQCDDVQTHSDVPTGDTEQKKAGLSTVSVLLEPDVELNETQEYVLWAAANGTAWRQALAGAGFDVANATLWVAWSTPLPVPPVPPIYPPSPIYTVSAPVAANAGVGMLAMAEPGGTLYPAAPPSSIWWHESNRTRVVVDFGLPINDLGGAQAAGILTAPPGSALAELLDATSIPVIVTVRFPAFEATITPRAI